MLFIDYLEQQNHQESELANRICDLLLKNKKIAFCFLTDKLIAYVYDFCKNKNIVINNNQKKGFELELCDLISSIISEMSESNSYKKNSVSVISACLKFLKDEDKWAFLVEGRSSPG